MVFAGPSASSSVTESKLVKVLLSAMAVDGTALKPGVQFDIRSKENVGLAIEADLKFCQDTKKWVLKC